jgi:hypothetical protein
MHTYIHVCIHTYMHTSIHTYITAIFKSTGTRFTIMLIGENYARLPLPKEILFETDEKNKLF